MADEKNPNNDARREKILETTTADLLDQGGERPQAVVLLAIGFIFMISLPLPEGFNLFHFLGTQ